MNCPYCKKEAKYGPNEEYYGRRFGRSYMCYYCKDCDAYVGTHNNTTKPLGTMANKPLRELRMRIHAIIDPLWRNRKISRGKVYQRLSDAFGREIHIGGSDENTCKEILRTLPLLFNSK